MAVEILREHERPEGPAFVARLSDPRSGVDAAPRLVEVRLSWADYNRWSPDGALPPARIARAVAEVLLDHHAGGDLPESFDASTVARRIPGGDAAIRSRLTTDDS